MPERFGARFLACESGRRAGARARDRARPSKRLAVCRCAAARLEHCSTSGDACPAGPSCAACRCIPRRARPACRKSRCGPDLPRWKKPGIMPRRCRSTPTTRSLAIPPMSHAYGYGMCVMVPLLTGASIVSMRRFSAKTLQRAMVEHPADHCADGAGHARRRCRSAAAATCGRCGGCWRPEPSCRAARPNNFHSQTGTVASRCTARPKPAASAWPPAASGDDVDGRVGPAMDGSRGRHPPRG